MKRNLMKLSARMGKVFAALALLVTVSNVNSTCLFITHQPELMFKKTACKITQRLCEKGIISESDFDLYEYGFNMGITVLLNLISTIVIGVIVGKVFESIAFLVFYIPLRSYAGGYHASTPRRCYFIFI